MNEKTNKLIVIAFFLIFALGLFFSVRFLKKEISQVINNSAAVKSDSALDIGSWEKIKDRFR